MVDNVRVESGESLKGARSFLLPRVQQYLASVSSLCSCSLFTHRHRFRHPSSYSVRQRGVKVNPLVISHRFLALKVEPPETGDDKNSSSGITL